MIMIMHSARSSAPGGHLVMDLHRIFPLPHVLIFQGWPPEVVVVFHSGYRLSQLNVCIFISHVVKRAVRERVLPGHAVINKLPSWPWAQDSGLRPQVSPTPIVMKCNALS